MKLKDILRNRLVIVGIFIGLALVNLVVTTVAFVKGDTITGLAFGLFTLNLLCGAFKYLKWEEDIRELHQYLDEVYNKCKELFGNEKKPKFEVHAMKISEEAAKRLSEMLENIRRDTQGINEAVRQALDSDKPSDEAPASSQDAADHTDADLTHEEAVKMNLIDNEAGSGDGC